jgi:hypothetical protein
MVGELDKAYAQHESDIEEAMNEVGLTLDDTNDEYTNFKEHVEEQVSGSDGVVA